MDQPSINLYVSLTLALIADSVIFAYFIRSLQDQILLAGIVLSFGFQCFWLLLYLIFSGSAVIDIGPQFMPDLNEAPNRIAVGLVLLPLIALVIGRLFSDRRGTALPDLLRAVESRRYRTFERFLFAFAIGLVLYFVAILLGSIPFVTQAVMYVHLSFFITPVLVGLCWKTYRRPAIVFLVILVIGGCLAFASGSRSLLFLPALFFAVGVWVTLRRKGKLLAAAFVIVVGTPVFYFSALMEKVRKDVAVESATSTFARADEIKRLAKEESQSESITAGLAQGVRRMVMWSNIVALDMTPERVPYRGFGDFWDEVLFMNKSTLFQDPREYLEESLEKGYGLGGARFYGFSLSTGGSVPFPVLADAWFRDGLLGVFLFGAPLCFAWAATERLVRRAYRYQPMLILTFIAILLSSSYDKMSVYGFIYNARYLVMQVALWSSVFYLVGRFTHDPRLIPWNEIAPQSMSPHKLSRRW